ncbi:MAG: hypothetical protein ACXIVD_07460 [Salinarimonas sp.]
MKSTEYETGVAEWLRVHFPPPEFHIEHDVWLGGSLSGCDRQIDVAVWDVAGNLQFVVEAKMHRRKIALDTAGEALSIIQDVRMHGSGGIVVASAGFSVAAARLLAGLGINSVQVTIGCARAANWIPELQKIFPIDAEFKIASGELMEALRSHGIEIFLDKDLPFEEWLAVLAIGRRKYPYETVSALREIAKRHSDSGHRFNAIRILDEMDQIDETILGYLLAMESDSDTVEFLESMRDKKS